MKKRRTIYWKIEGVLRRIGYVTFDSDNVTIDGIVLDPQVNQVKLFRDYLRRQFDES